MRGAGPAGRQGKAAEGRRIFNINQCIHERWRVMSPQWHARGALWYKLTFMPLGTHKSAIFQATEEPRPILESSGPADSAGILKFSVA